MAYTECNYISANYIEHEIHYAGNYGAKGEKRSERSKPTPLEIKKNNHWNKVKYYRRLMQLNFYPGDLWTCLKYKAGTRKEIDLVKKDISRFFSYLRTAYKKRGHRLMFIYKLEIGKRGGLHCHVVVNRIPDADLLMRDAWKKATDDAGSIDYQTIEEYGGYSGLSEYICKEPDEEIQGQISFLIPEDKKKVYSISSSRNLKRPEPVRKKYSHWTLRKILSGGDIKPTEGFYIDKDTIKKGINRFTGMSYLYYTEVRQKMLKREEVESGQAGHLCLHGHQGDS